MAKSKKNNEVEVNTLNLRWGKSVRTFEWFDGKFEWNGVCVTPVTALPSPEWCATYDSDTYSQDSEHEDSPQCALDALWEGMEEIRLELQGVHKKAQ